MWGNKKFGLIFVTLWIAVVCYVIINHTALIGRQLFITTSDSEERSACNDPLNYTSTCDLRQYYLRELQSHRVRVYEEHNLTTLDPLRLLFYTHMLHYQRVMDRWWYFRYDAANRNPFINATLWGPGFDGYNNNKTLRENIIKEFGRADYFHVIIVALWEKEYLPGLLEMSNDSATMKMYNEAWCIPDNSGDRCGNPPPIAINVSLIGFAYASEMLQSEWQHFGLRRHLFHIPNTVCAERFYKPSSSLSPSSSSYRSKAPKSLEEAVAAYDRERDIDVLMVGAMHRQIYPIRWKVTCMYNSGYFKDLPYNVYHSAHPGYSKEETNITTALEQVDYFAALLRRSKLVVTDSSRYHYALQKYSEIAAAGALILADIPDEREDEFNLYVARVHHKMKPGEIMEVIKYWLENPVKRYQRARLGQVITMQKYTNDHSTDLIIGAYLRLKQRRYGTHFAYPFADTCKVASPMHISRYCDAEDQKEEGDANIHLDEEHGWYLPPLNCSLQFSHSVTPPL